jgi:hypothetical protein
MACRAPKQKANMSRCVQTCVFIFLNMVTAWKVSRLFQGRVNRLSLRGGSDGNHINRCSHRVFARRWGLGIFPLAQGLALSWCQERHFRAVAQSAASFPNGGLPNGNSIYRRSGRLAFAGLAGSNQTDGGRRTEPPRARPARRNSAGRGSASESFVCTSEGLAVGKEPTACGAQMAKARRRGSRVLRSVRCTSITN